MLFFFFQAEDGIRDIGVTGVQTCALPISELSHHEPSTFDIAGRRVGGGETFCLIAGPCTVESRTQTLSVAQAVKAAGASMLRGGAFKPRTSPFAFKGLGTEIGRASCRERG